MAFIDTKPTLNPGCPLEKNPNYNCRKHAVKKTLDGVNFSAQVYYVDLPSVLNEVCEFCIKEHKHGR